MVFDLETTGFIASKPYVVSIAFKIFAPDDEMMYEYYQVVEPPYANYEIPLESVKIHGISTEHARIYGISMIEVINTLHHVVDVYEIDTLIAHNIKFDVPVLRLQLERFDKGDASGIMLCNKIRNIQTFCTMMAGINVTNIYKAGKYGTFKKQPRLSELYDHLFSDTFNAHNAKDDVDACARCYTYMKTHEMLYL
jgi:DNA polymerase III epsilon subunit-like protein